MLQVAKQAGVSSGELGAALPSCYQGRREEEGGRREEVQGRREEVHTPYSGRREGRSLSEGRFDGQFVSYMKQPSREVSPQEGEEEGEVARVLSPTSLLLSPASTPLDLTTKRAAEAPVVEVEEVEELPTDYSLRYQEGEHPDKSAEATKPEMEFDDLPRTYCTEGTPMDTPFAFSTATSMSDLREPAIQEEEEEQEQEEKEVTVQYAVEGTPCVFSRAESLSDLEEVEGGEGEGAKLQAIPETGEEKGMAETEGEKEGAGSTPPPLPKEKTVKFREGAEGGAPHETPLMFSRASSVASLDSFDQEGSLPDGYSSYDASRATSGRVSPSDLPDSPSQTMPGSPRPRPPPRPAKASGAPPLAPAAVKSMYADVVTSYQEEGTPAVFSTRTSLSGLSAIDFEDEEKEKEEKKPEEERKEEVEEAKSANSTMSEDEDIYADSESLLGQLITSAMPDAKQAAAPRSRLPKPRTAWAPRPSGDSPRPSTESPQSTESPRPSRESPRPSTESPRPGEGSDDSTCSGEHADLLEDCIASAMPVPTARLGPRMAAEGAPAPDPKAGRRKRTPPVAMVAPRQPPAPPERKGSHLSHPCVAAAAASQDDFRRGGDTVRCWGAVEDTPLNFSAATSLSDLTVEEPSSGRFSAAEGARGRGTGQASGVDTPRRFMTEDTPAVFSRNDSLSSLEYEEEQRREAVRPPARHAAGSGCVSSPGSFQSHLPRPSAVGRSGSSGSSTGASEAAGRTANTQAKSFNSSLSSLSVESLDNTGQEEEDLLADCISSAMPKSKSEHFDLSSKSKKSKKSPARERPSLAKSSSGGLARERSQGSLVREKSGSNLVRESSASNLKSRSSSKSPRGSRMIPGVVIPELKLLPRSRPHSQEIKEIMEVKEIRPSGEVRLQEKVKEAVEVKEDRLEMMEETLTESRVSSLGLGSLTQSGLTEAGLVAEALHLSSSYSEAGPASYSEAGPASLIVDQQPPSLMLDSLPSLSLPTAAPRRPSMPEAAPRGLQCRHTLSGKLGSSVPVAVRRALGGAMGAVSAEDLSSISSCHSNIDNIQPPTYMEELDMDSSMISVASLTSDAANLAVLGGSGSTDSASVSITSEAIRDMVGPAGRAVRDFQDSSIISAPNMTMSGMSQELAMVGPPTAMEDLTLTTGTGTLVADLPAGGTFVVNAEENNDTIADVPDAFDDEETVNEPTLTAGSEGQDCEAIPELPRDSRHTTPAQSGGESSVEGTPSTRRKVSPKERRQVDRERYLTFTKEQEMEETLTASRAGQLTETTEFRAAARGVEEDRFRTRTITKEDLATSPSSSPEKSSPSSSRSSKQRRAEEGARFLTQTIGPGDLVRREEEAAFDRREEEEESLNAAVLESEALRVVASLSFQGRSRSQSTEILGEAEMADSREELRSRDTSGEKRPRVVKPWESRVQEQEAAPPGIRGRRRALYSPPMKRATIPPPVAPKPQLSRPRTASSPQTSPRMVRGTRATQLRQANARKEAPRAVSPAGPSQGLAQPPPAPLAPPPPPHL